MFNVQLWSRSTPESRIPSLTLRMQYRPAYFLAELRSAYKHHLFTFPHYSVGFYSLQNWSPRSTQCPQALTVVLTYWKHIQEIDLDGSNLLLFPRIFDNHQWSFNAFPKYAVRARTYLSFSVISVCHVHTSILF